MEYIKRIRDLREDSDKTQTEIAEYLGTSQTMYARYERGANELPIRHLLALCKYYDVSADNVSKNEIKLLNVFRSLSADKQERVLEIIFDLGT